MQKKISLRLTPEEAASESHISRKIIESESTRATELSGFQVLKRSIDARGKNILINLSVLAFLGEPFHPITSRKFIFKDVHQAKHSVIIIGAGPAGLFAALKLIEAGIKPVVIERGKDVRSRRRDLAALNRDGIVNPESNYCFGEGGAGTYSDGKLYTRSNKRGDINRILHLFVHFGAEENILFDAHPHIGTNKLPGIITAMRNQVIESGGIVLFEHKLTGFNIKGNIIKSVFCNDTEFHADAYILATGHSARDIFRLMHHHSLEIEAKPFALGVRVEHPQQLIDSIQYHTSSRPELLPPASYTLVQQVDNNGMFSFCMCPGGIIAPASTTPGEIVVNGWSPSKRNNPFANSGMVVEVTKADAILALKKDSANPISKIDPDDPLLFLEFQQMVEQNAFIAGGGGCIAPAQRLTDFCSHKLSTSLPKNSYLPGLHSADLSEVLPQFIYKVLSKGFPLFGKKMKGYYTNEAVVVATESRTSSPVKIPRHNELLHHPQIENLFPCGEGAGYAGGIVSAAMDGEKVAARIAERAEGLSI